MIAALALAAALQADTYVDDAGCRWKRKPVVIQNAARKPAASGVLHQKPKRPAKAKPAAKQDEFIGCDEGGFGVWKSDLLADVDFMGTEVFVPIEEVMGEVAGEPVVLPTFEQACDCAVGVVEVPIFVGGGGGVVVHTPPVPEPSMWLLMVLGLIGLWRVRG